MHFAWLGGLMMSLCGRAHARVSHSQTPAVEKEQKMKDTSGLKCKGSSPSADLQSALESKLRARMDVNGSPEYVLTWKYWDMLSGPRICALWAKARRISDSDYTGWPTAMAGTPAQKGYNAAGNTDSSRKTVALAAGWASAAASDWKDQANEIHGTHSPRLGQQVLLFLAPTGNSGVLPATARLKLNPRFSLWLLGFPIEWAQCAERVTRLTRGSRKAS